MRHGLWGASALAIVLAASCEQPGGTVHVSSITVSPSDWTLLTAQTQVDSQSRPVEQLTVHFHPPGATNKHVHWAISDQTNATVSSTGLVTWIGNASGQQNLPLTVTATSEDGGFVATVTGDTSCPLLYVGDGHGGFTYLTDLQGPIIGMPSTNIMADRTRLYSYDYVVLNGLAADSQGRYEVKLREAQAEITYLDDARLVPVDLPDGYEVVSSSAELTYGNNQPNRLTLTTIHHPHPLIKATDSAGADVTAALKTTDGRPAPLAGTTGSYELDFGSFDVHHAKLLIDAWALYSPTYRSDFVLPSVEVKDSLGRWTKVLTFGLPAGDVKTMVLDLADKFLSSDRHVRLNLGSRPWVRWVVDGVRMDDSAPVAAPHDFEEVPETAVLSQAGGATIRLATETTRASVADDAVKLNGVGMGRGGFTRYGDVTALVSKGDDQFAIFGLGDQVSLDYAALPPVAQGKHRVFILKVLQYYKAFYENSEVDPLPFHGMTSYPYSASEHYPLDAEHRQYLAAYNTRVN
jgi:hypothetical protein